jgi:hypothetical protein
MPDVKRENPDAFKLLGDKLAAMDGVTGKVGWFESAQYPDGTPVAYAAAINEMGSPRNSIPARSFFRSTAAEQDGKWKETANTVSSMILEGKITPQQGMEILCLKAEGDVAAKIASITSPPLSPITLGARKYRQQGKTVTGATIGEIARKLKDGTLDISGVSDKPLVDSSLMINTLTSTVEG